ncbi:CoA binding domain protein [Planctomycetes bacterium Pan216]|uniref:CoA binding domain protein n=1 Tax=Kolteria novifilia TaxID=2527975 RepID=A0A518BD45_9BACT|nr:CoA binding domain protein [Planctomycetes bacterium Pan216]
MATKTVAILGASSNRDKFGNKSVRAHLQQGFKVFPVNPRAETIEGLKCYPSISEVPGPLDRVSIYLPPAIGLEVIEEVAACKPNEVWLNPGAESNELIRRAEELGLHVVVACSILGVGLSPASL